MIYLDRVERQPPVAFVTSGGRSGRKGWKGMAYWDRISATKPHPVVLDAVMNAYREGYGNPQSPHRVGSAARERLEAAREQVAGLLNAESREIIFGATGTEMNHLAIRGLAAPVIRKGRRKVLVSAVEHVSVMKAAKRLEAAGAEVEVLPVDGAGRVDRERYLSALSDEVGLVSIQTANPEVGTLQDIRALAEAAHSRGILFHTDAVAAAGWIPIDVRALGVDALSISAPVFHGVPGAAALYVRRGVRLEALAPGGVQERGLRAGQENVPAIVGMGAAAEVARSELPERMDTGRRLAQMLREGLSSLEAVTFTGDPDNRLPGHVSVLIGYVEGEALLLMLDMHGIQAASGSSCASKDLKISPVLMAMGVEHADAQGSLVFSSVYDTTEADVSVVVDAMPSIVERLRAMSPLWAQRGE